MLRTLVKCLLCLGLWSCGVESTEESGSLDQTASAPYCPSPFSFNAKTKLCESSTEALGPFPSAMITKCLEFGGGDGCKEETWALAMARSTRGSGSCPAGTTIQQNLCSDGTHAYGPFSQEHVLSCRQKKGGQACESLRWNFDFALNAWPQAAFTFPLSGPALANYTDPPRSFGACRDDCTRRHAAADLYAATGTPIRAIGTGEVIDFYEFYLGTYALVVDHGDFIVRYGEIKGSLPQGVKVGSKIVQGQTIAYVGRLVGLSQDMLHFERFAGWAQGPLTVTGNYPYQRRKDLVDPTQDLLAWKYPR